MTLEFSSPETHELTKALISLQQQIGGVPATSRNPHYHSKYPDLATVWETVRGPLGQAGFAVTQVPGIRKGELVLNTLLLHVSGQWIRGVYPLRPIKPDPQGYGSALTYARRYSLMAILGLCPEDDDGEAACSPLTRPSSSRPEHDGRPGQARPPVPIPTSPAENFEERLLVFLGKVMERWAETSPYTAADTHAGRLMQILGYLVGRAVEAAEIPQPPLHQIQAAAIDLASRDWGWTKNTILDYLKVQLQTATKEN